MMKYQISRDTSSPAYLQLYRQLREDIVRGIYPYGSKLPSKRMIAEELGLSTVTVEHAFGLLDDEGYIQPRERSGYYVIFRTDDGFTASPEESPGKDVWRPHTGRKPPAVPAEFPFSVLTKAMRRVISDRGEAILDRSPNLGMPEFRGAISRYLNRSRGITADVSQIVIGSGSEYLYGLIVELLGRGRIYGIESPSYKKIEQVYQACDVRIEKLPLGRDGIESGALRESRADILHLSPYRSFPSGVTASASKRHEYIRWAARNGRYLVEDDFESEFSVLTKPEETLFALSQDDNVIYMNTFSQTVSPSLRAGYMVLPGGLVSEFADKLGFYACTVPTYIQYVLAELLESGDFERHINRVRRQKREAAKKEISFSAETS